MIYNKFYGGFESYTLDVIMENSNIFHQSIHRGSVRQLRFIFVFICNDTFFYQIRNFDCQPWWQLFKMREKIEKNVFEIDGPWFNIVANSI